MSAYAALVSLLQILGTILDGGGLFNIHNRAQLQSLHENVIFFLDFLDNSSVYKTSQISALEAKMREAAYRAEDLIESQISAILDSDTRRLRLLVINTVFNFFYFFLVLSNRIPVSLPEMLPEWFKIFMLVIFIPALAAIAICTMCAFGVYLALEASNFLDLNDSRPQETQDLRLVLYDLSFIVKDVTRIKEARGDLEMSASAALLSLRKILDSILESGVSHNRSQLESLHEKVTFLLDFLGNASAYMASTELQSLEEKIGGAVIKANKLIEFQIPAQIILNSDRKSFRRLMKFMFLVLLSSVSALALTRMPVPIQLVVGWVVIVTLGFGVLALGTNGAEILAAINNSEMRQNQELCLIIDDLSIIVEDVTKIKDACGNLSTYPAAASTSSSSRRGLGGTGKNVVVGLERDMEQIKARLIQDSSKLEVIPIVGMGGIGKTTLATQVYNDLDITYSFDIRAWVTISQEYSLRNVLLVLLDSAKILTKQMQKSPQKDWVSISTERLGERLHRNLKGRRYLIVMDDVWDKKVLDFFRRFFPDDCIGSRVILTCRLSDVASYLDSGSHLHQMRCLNEMESWYLLREKVFGAEGCPFELESIGREIAQSCRGLPLAILVIGGLLYKDRQSIIWREVAENLNLKLRQVEDVQC